MCLSQGHRFECRIRSVENFNKVDFYWLPSAHNATPFEAKQVNSNANRNFKPIQMRPNKSYNLWIILLQYNIFMLW